MYGGWRTEEDRGWRKKWMVRTKRKANVNGERKAGYSHTPALKVCFHISLSLSLSFLCFRLNVRDIGHPRDRTVQADGADLDVDLLLP